MPFPFVFPFTFDADPSGIRPFLTFPITFPLWFKVPPDTPQGLHFYVDWDSDGDVTEAIEDVTADFQKLTTLRGRDSELDRAIAGQAGITLRDLTGKYIRENPTSVLHDILMPGVMCQLVYTEADGTTRYIFTGYVDDVVPNVYDKTAYVPLLDGFSVLNTNWASLAIQSGKKSGEIIGKVLDSAGWPADRRRLDAGQDTYDLAYLPEETPALTIMQNVEASEFGFLYMGTNGDVCWEDRYYRLTEARCTASQWTCSASKYRKITPMNPVKGIKNYVVITCQPKTRLPDLSVVWTCSQNLANGNPMLLNPGHNFVWVGFVDAAGNPQIAADVVTPVATTDYVANFSPLGTGTDATGWIVMAPLVDGTNLWASGCKLDILNTLAYPVYMMSLQVRGYTFLTENTYMVKSPETAPTTNRREYRINAPFYSSIESLQGIADHIRDSYETPNPRYEIELVGKSIDLSDEVSIQIRTRDISDRIHVECAEYGLDGDYIVEKIRHEIISHGTAGEEWHTWWTVSSADSNNYWTLGVSELGVDVTGLRTPFRTKVAF